jgi:hypothetical protein
MWVSILPMGRDKQPKPENISLEFPGDLGVWCGRVVSPRKWKLQFHKGQWNEVDLSRDLHSRICVPFVEKWEMKTTMQKLRMWQAFYCLPTGVWIPYLPTNYHFHKHKRHRLNQLNHTEAHEETGYHHSNVFYCRSYNPWTDIPPSSHEEEAVVSTKEALQ